MGSLTPWHNTIDLATKMRSVDNLAALAVDETVILMTLSLHHY